MTEATQAPDHGEWIKSSLSYATSNCVEASWVKSSFSFANSNCVEVGTWGKASYSGGNGGGCVEVQGAPGGYQPSKQGTAILVRDSKNPDGAVLEFDAAEWDAFIAGAKAGEFDRP